MAALTIAILAAAAAAVGLPRMCPRARAAWAIAAGAGLILCILAAAGVGESAVMTLAGLLMEVNG